MDSGCWDTNAPLGRNSKRFTADVARDVEHLGTGVSVWVLYSFCFVWVFCMPTWSTAFKIAPKYHLFKDLILLANSLPPQPQWLSVQACPSLMRSLNRVVLKRLTIWKLMFVYACTFCLMLGTGFVDWLEKRCVFIWQQFSDVNLLMPQSSTGLRWPLAVDGMLKSRN